MTSELTRNLLLQICLHRLIEVGKYFLPYHSVWVSLDRVEGVNLSSTLHFMLSSLAITEVQWKYILCLQYVLNGL